MAVLFEFAGDVLHVVPVAKRTVCGPLIEDYGQHLIFDIVLGSGRMEENCSPPERVKRHE